MDSHEGRIDRIETLQGKMGEAIVMLRETVAKVATKDDIMVLSEKMDDKFGQQLTQAHNSIPTKISLLFTGGMFVLALLGFAMSHFK